MKKKTISALLALSMVLGVGASAMAEEQDLRTLTLLGFDNGYDVFSEEARERYPMYVRFREELANRGIEVNWDIVSSEQYKTVLPTRLASGNIGDMVSLSPMTDAEVVELGQNGVILPINKVLEENGGEEALNYLKEKLDFVLPRITASDGNIYWLPSVNPLRTYEGDKEGFSTLSVIIRQDWLDKVGMEMPTTADEFKEVLKAFQEQDVNGNGVKDEVVGIDPVSSMFETGIAQWFGLGQKLASYDYSTGKIVCPWYQEGVKDYLAYMKELIDEGLLDTSLIGLESGAPLDQKIAENAVSAAYNWSTQRGLEPSIGVEEALYAPMIAQGKEGLNAYLPAQSGKETVGKFAISSSCEDLEAMADLINYMYSDEYADLVYWGVEGVSYEVDERGIKYTIGDYKGTFQEKEEKGTLSVDNLLGSAGCTIPILRYCWVETEIEGQSAPEKADFMTMAQTYEYKFATTVSNFQSLPSEEQIETINECYAELETYSKELLGDILLGRASLDDWDSYIEELNDMGLEEYISIQQELVDRYNSVQ